MIIIDQVFLDQTIELLVEPSAYSILCSLHGFDVPDIEDIGDTNGY